MLDTAAAGWRIVEPPGPADDDRLVELARDCDVIGLDAPLGWPIGFVDAVLAHRNGLPWPAEHHSALTYRTTDRTLPRLPLSVAADKLAVVAMRAALLQSRWAAEVWAAPAPRDGSGRLVETYPAAALAAWGIGTRGYKDRRTTAGTTARTAIIEGLNALLPWIDLDAVHERCIASDHVLDAVVCALVAHAAHHGHTRRPDDTEHPIALVEGWIHVPDGPLPRP